MKKHEIIDTTTEKQQTEEITKVCQAWCGYSLLHDYPAMLDLCIENSRFAELTNACARSTGLGIFYHYEFKNIKVIQIVSNTNYAIVTGDIKLIQSGQKNIFNGKFQSSCIYHSSSNKPWKLDEIEVEWEM
ncbi:MAG: hypothetical protein K8S00_00735 [Bacteroidales bacterium]|nr:hypothetical protein [Bacteroidales bacterium]